MVVCSTNPASHYRTKVDYIGHKFAHWVKRITTGINVLRNTFARKAPFILVRLSDRSSKKIGSRELVKQNTLQSQTKELMPVIGRFGWGSHESFFEGTILKCGPESRGVCWIKTSCSAFTCKFIHLLFVGNSSSIYLSQINNSPPKIFQKRQEVPRIWHIIIVERFKCILFLLFFENHFF